MADITMSLDDTLELDTIVKESNIASNPVGNIQYEGSDSTVHNFTGFQTHTGVFDPQESGKYVIPINGQELTIKVTEPSSILDGVVDNFESSIYEEQNKKLSDYYSGDTGGFSRSTKNPVEGSYHLKANGNGGYYGMSSSSGLPNYPSQGDKFSVRCLLTNGSNEEDARMTFGYQDNSNYYSIAISPNQGYFAIEKRENGSTSALDSKNRSFSKDEWYKSIITWDTNGSITGTLEDSNGNQLESVSATDNTWSSGSVGFLATAVGGLNDDIYYDNFVIL